MSVLGRERGAPQLLVEGGPRGARINAILQRRIPL
jgi:hypothetical protein